MLKDIQDADARPAASRSLHLRQRSGAGGAIHAALVSGVEQVEMELRRKVEEATGDGSVRSPGGETVPQGFADAVAEYSARLSKSK